MARTFPKNGYDPLTGEWNDSLAGDFLWSNVNVSEAVPDVMTPSTWSLWWIHHYEANPIQFPGNYRFCGNICGRPYLNLSLIVSLYSAVGKDIRQELQGDMIGSAPANLDVPRIPFSPLRVLWTALPGLIKAQQSVSRDRRRIPEFVAATPGWCRTQGARIQACEDRSALLTMWCATIKPYFFRTCEVLRGAALLFSDAATRLRLDLIKLAGEAEANTILSNLSGAGVKEGPATDMESLGPLVGLAQVRRGTLSRAAYMERYGHRGPHEMELSAPGAEEDPNWLDLRLAESNQSKADVGGLLAKQRAEYVAAWARFGAGHPQKAEAYRRQVEKVSVAARNREAVRSEVTRVTRLVRRYLLRAGELADIGEEIFFLSLDEVAEILSGIETPKKYIAARRKAFQRYTALPPYPAIIIGRFDPFRWAADPNRRSDYFDSRFSIQPATPATLSGFAGAAGRVKGIVRCIDRPEDGYLLQPGEILVTITTNVGWTPIFPRAAAIITDVGAPLSHAAIVARELGIPAVVGCGNATMRLHTGDCVWVDGSRGVVEIQTDPKTLDRKAIVEPEVKL